MEMFLGTKHKYACKTKVKYFFSFIICRKHHATAECRDERQEKEFF